MPNVSQASGWCLLNHCLLYKCTNAEVPLTRQLIGPSGDTVAFLKGITNWLAHYVIVLKNSPPIGYGFVVYNLNVSSISTLNV